MTNAAKLRGVKILHTLIWLFFNFVLAYLFYAAATNQIGLWFWIGIVTIGIECFILVMNNWICPLTPIARRYSDSTKENFDIYLPNWVAKNNKIIYSILLLLLVVVYIVNNN